MEFLFFLKIIFFKKKNIFFSKNLKIATCQFIIVPHGSLWSWHVIVVIVVFNLVPNLNFWFNLVLQFF